MDRDYLESEIKYQAAANTVTPKLCQASPGNGKAKISQWI